MRRTILLVLVCSAVLFGSAASALAGKPGSGSSSISGDVAIHPGLTTDWDSDGQAEFYYERLIFNVRADGGDYLRGWWNETDGVWHWTGYVLYHMTGTQVLAKNKSGTGWISDLSQQFSAMDGGRGFAKDYISLGGTAFTIYSGNVLFIR